SGCTGWSVGNFVGSVVFMAVMLRCVQSAHRLNPDRPPSMPRSMAAIPIGRCEWRRRLSHRFDPFVDPFFDLV
ncbi:MAG TPA: hypothetical protein V6D46_04775, partial [Coleofasciculaceae cyanobacterium]